MYRDLDKENMFGAIWNFPENMKEALNVGNRIVLKQEYCEIQNIVIVGMGGSAIGGDVVSVLEKSNIKIPLTICRGYSVPQWVKNKTLVIFSSYSGNTEETLSALDDAIKKRAVVCGLTTGGMLAERLKKLEMDVIIVPSGLQPRAALAYSFIPMIKLLEKIGLIETNIDTWLQQSIESISSKRLLYSKNNDDNPLIELSKNIYKKIPIIYSDTSTMKVAGVRLKGQICENSKMLSFFNELPEQNHNEIVGWENNPKLFNHLFVVWLVDESDNPRVKLRTKITQTILEEKGVDQITMRVQGNSFQERFLNMIHYGDWLSFWCAILHQTNPSPVKNIDRLKKTLMSNNDPR